MLTSKVKNNGVVDTVNDAFEDPAGTVTVWGSEVRNGRSVDKYTRKPPAGAVPLSVTVPVDELPPVMLEGFSDKAESTTGVTVSDAVLATLL